jgi:restriction system protein
MKDYHRIMLGRQSVHAEEAFAGNFIGADFSIREDLSGKLPEDWHEFNGAFIPVFLQNNPEKSKIAAGLAMGMLWTVSKGIAVGDTVLCPDGKGFYRVGEVVGDYEYQPEGALPHRRPVRWLDVLIDRSEMSEGLRNSCGSIGTVSLISKHAKEIEGLIRGVPPAGPPPGEPVEDPAAFAMEKHLEDFLVQNWNATELSRDFEIYQDEGEVAGQQFPTDTGPMDIFAVSKDRKTLLVIELKKGRASDVVAGQILRYMGYVKEELAEPDQTVKGLVIALEEDQRLRRALAMVPDIDFFRYEVSFRLVKSS